MDLCHLPSELTVMVLAPLCISDLLNISATSVRMREHVLYVASIRKLFFVHPMEDAHAGLRLGLGDFVAVVPGESLLHIASRRRKYESPVRSVIHTLRVLLVRHQRWHAEVASPFRDFCAREANICSVEISAPSHLLLGAGFLLHRVGIEARQLTWRSSSSSPEHVQWMSLPNEAVTVPPWGESWMKGVAGLYLEGVELSPEAWASIACNLAGHPTLEEFYTTGGNVLSSLHVLLSLASIPNLSTVSFLQRPTIHSWYTTPEEWDLVEDVAKTQLGRDQATALQAVCRKMRSSLALECIDVPAHVFPFQSMTADGVLPISLYLRDCPFVTIECLKRIVGEVKHVDCMVLVHLTNITSIPAMGRLSDTMEMHIESTPLRSIHPSFLDLPFLVKLRLRNLPTLVGDVGVLFAKLPQLTELDLDGDPLLTGTFPGSLLAGLRAISLLRCHGVTITPADRLAIELKSYYRLPCGANNRLVVS